MTATRVLVAGVGNLFLGDDGFGPAVVKRLAARRPRGGVDLVDFGVRAVDLAYALLDGYRMVVMVDAVSRGGRPGTLYVLDPGRAKRPPPTAIGHALVAEQVFALAGVLGGGPAPGVVRIVGCEPDFIPEEPEMHIGLSDPVEGAIDPAIELVEQLLGEAHA